MLITKEANTAIKANNPFGLEPRTTVGKVTLNVADLAMLTDYYERVIGLTTLERSSSTVEMGVAERPLLRLVEQPNGKQYRNSVGLYHFALLLPTRSELGRWLKHMATNQYAITGGSDHLVSNAIYLNDPEGNGIEVYWDLPSEDWLYDKDNNIKIGSYPLDYQALGADAAEGAFERMPDGTTMGHVHLQTNDVTQTVDFFTSVLGFDAMNRMPSAGFVGVGGYHHHLGINEWQSKGSSRPPEGSLGLQHYEIVLPNHDARSALLNQLDSLNIETRETDGHPSVLDPSGNRAVLSLA